MGDLSTTGFSAPVEVVSASTGQCTSKYLMQGPSYPAAEECLAAATYAAAAAAAAAGSQVVGLAPVEASEVLSGDWQQVIQGMQYPVSSPAVSSVPAAAAATARRPFASSELSHGSSTLTQSPTAQGLESGCWTTGIQGITPQCFSSSDYAPQSPSFRADNFAEVKRPRSRQDSPRKEESLCSAQTPTNRKRRSNSRSAATSGDKRQKLETKADSENSGNSSLKSGKEKPPEPPKDYIHVRARRGQATDSHSLAERVRREKISERMKFLQDLVPGCSKVTGKAVMLDEIINYVQSLQRQVEFLSMKLAAVNPRLDLNLECLIPKELRAPSMTPSPGAFQQQLQQAQQGVVHPLNSTDAAISSSSTQAWEGGDLQSIVQMFGSLVNFPTPTTSFMELENSVMNPFTQSKA